MEIFNFKRLNNAEVKDQNQVKIATTFAASKKLDGNVDINRA